MSNNIFKFLIKDKFNFKAALKNFKFYSEIKNSGFFDESFYRKTYSEYLKNEDPLTHYLTEGYKLGFLPSLNFDSDAYLETYPQVRNADINPLLHYIAHGQYEDKLVQSAYSVRRKEEILETNLMFLNNYKFEREPLISIIILNLNGLSHLKRLFKDFDKKTNYSNYEIIVVDNGSSDESVKYLKNLKEELPIRIIENSENVSFSKGNNDAAKIANGEYLLLLNNDIEPTYGWLNEMMGTMLRNEKVGAVGAKLVFPYYYSDKSKSYKIQHSGDIFAERMTPCCVYAKNNSSSDLDLFDSHLNGTNKCIAVTGAVMLVKKDVYMDLGGLSEDYNYGLEDVDFCLNLHKNGFDTYYCGSALLFHHESSTRVKNKDYFDNDKKNYNVFWNRWGSFLSKHILLDKIHNEKFFSVKDLKIVFINNNHNFDKPVSEMVKAYSELGYEVAVISNIEDKYIGNSTDIVVSLADEYNFDDVIARDDAVKVRLHMDSSMPQASIVSSNSVKNDDVFLLDSESPVGFALDIIDHIEYSLVSCDGFLWD